MTQGPSNAGLLCLYAYFGNPTECKLTLLAGARSYDKFVSDALPFALNIFARGLDPARRAGLARPLLKHIIAIQRGYFAVLRDVGLAPDATLPFGAPPREGLPQYLRDTHRFLCQLDGTDPDDDQFDLHWRRASSPFAVEGDETLTERLASALVETQEARLDLIEFWLGQEHDAKDIYHSPNQATTEIMQYLTHVARAFRHSCDDRLPEAHKEMVAACRHLTRTTLDMRKSIITTAAKNFPGEIPDVTLRQALQARVDECNMGVDDPAKLRLFKAGAKAVLALRRAT